MKLFNKKTILTLSLWCILALILAVPCLAQTPVVELTNPLGPQEIKTEDILTKIGDIIGHVMGILGAIALAMFIYGGFTWLTSRGASDKIEKGKKIFVWAVIGLAIIFSSYLLVSLVINSLTTKPPAPQAPAVAPPAPPTTEVLPKTCMQCNINWSKECCVTCPVSSIPSGQSCP